MDVGGVMTVGLRKCAWLEREWARVWKKTDVGGRVTVKVSVNVREA